MNEGEEIFAHLPNMRVKAIIRVIQDSGVTLLRVVEETRDNFATQAEELLEKRSKALREAKWRQCYAPLA